MMLMENRTALVTGAAGLLGRSIVETLLHEGARVIAVDREPVAPDLFDTPKATSDDLVCLCGDVSNEADVRRLFSEAETKIAQPDVLVNCAGRYLSCALVDMTVEEWEEAFRLNVRTTMLMSREAAQRWISAGIKGAIVNISSGAGTSARAGSAHYAASKAAVNMLTEVMAIEFGPAGIRVNAISPGMVLDAVVTGDSSGNHPYINLSLQGTPLGRSGQPQDVAQAVVFLASNRSAWTTGINMPVTGGAHCGRPHMPLAAKSQLGVSDNDN